MFPVQASGRTSKFGKFYGAERRSRSREVPGWLCSICIQENGRIELKETTVIELHETY